jgi:hypothetical protein
MRRIVASVVAVLLIASLAAARASAQTTKPSAKITIGSRPAGASAQPSASPTNGKTVPPSSDPKMDAKRALNTRMPETKLSGIRLEEAIDFLQDASGANIHVNWRALETVNVTRETQVTVRVQSLPLRKVLKYVLTEADGAGLITFYAEDGVIEVTTREMADQRLITKVYPVEDLLLTIPDFTDAPQFQLQQANQTSGRGGGGGGSSQGLFTGTNTTETGNVRDRANRGNELVQLVMDTVEPEAWRENGGTASIRFFRGKLIITAPRSVHEKIGGAVE